MAFDVPILAHWDDGELEGHFPERDGRWSHTTRSIVTALGADRLDLNAAWSSVPQSWTCPACQRGKPHIARLTKAGVILARLEEHHDHLGDVINAGLRARVGQRWPEMLEAGAGKLAGYSEKLVRRFEPDLICHDCNLADGKAKSQLKGLPRSFSFSPSEIGRFIKVAANREHGVDLEAARAIWASVQTQFEANTALAHILVDKLASGALVQEQGKLVGAESSNPLSVRAFLYSAAFREDRDLLHEIAVDLEAFERQSIARDGTASSTPKRRSRGSETPTDADVDEHDGNGSPDLWHGVASDWRCPGCDRTRRGVLRSARRPPRRWSGRLHKHTEYALDACDDVGPVVATHQNLRICGDCASVLTGVKQRRADLSHDKAFLQLADMRAVAKAADHHGHEIDWPAAAERVRLNNGRRPAIDAYRSQVNEAHYARSMLASFTERYGDRDAMRCLRVHYRRNEPDLNADELDTLISVLLETAERLPTLSS